MKKDKETQLKNYEYLISRFPEPIVVIDGSGVVLLSSIKIKTIVGGTGKIVGKNIFNLMDTGCSECTLTKSNIRKMLFDESWSCKTKHSTRKKSIKIKAHKTRFDNKNAFLLIFEDVTMQQEIDKMKASFVSMASHQLNTPLSTIRWYLELLSDKKTGKLNVKQKEYLKQIVDSNSRMISLVSDVLSVSHIESGEDIVSEKKPTDIVSIIKKAVDENIKRVDNGEISICKTMPKKIVLNINKSEIENAFNNIVDNSIKYSGDKKNIKICFKRDGGKVVFSVKDNGMGIPASQQDRVFNKFFRADNIQVTGESGTGLGLYLLKSVVVSHGGDVWFKSKEGVGTTFYLSFPK